ncbi:MULTISPECIES: TetR/AcrR family transcriptional regulator [Actinoalloteichus]|uniref:Transcriptional regulator, TetR family n=1 Tax=Actinoalloteichus fjordicus TaxID=1612552 RepID=A0AAC9PSL1_9PSEU|nr:MULTISPECIES: TetR/AcrR family transcriptional regulator [Actinoalloteichus]APU15125.1 transcriptional regulator, TetR family [Actinoalloteichus fjordicus]APU21193.1 transcriptional regulator, TetR family [Actinoalloteichus sp. GBA129-24]
MAATRGRPRSFDREAALTVATRLFWEHGYEATSIGALTEAMNIKPPSLYAAFGDKKALFDEVVTTYRQTHGEFMLRALDEEPGVRAGIARMLREAAAAYTDPALPPGCLVISGAANCSPANADVAERLRDLRNANLTGFEQRLRSAVAAGELPADTDVPVLASYLAAVIQGMSQRARDGASARELTALAETAMRAVPGGDEASGEGGAS